MYMDYHCYIICNILYVWVFCLLDIDLDKNELVWLLSQVAVGMMGAALLVIYHQNCFFFEGKV